MIIPFRFGNPEPAPIPFESMFGLGGADIDAMVGEKAKTKGRKKGWAKMLGF